MQLGSFTNSNTLQKDLLLAAPTFKLRGSVSGDGLANSLWRVDGCCHNAFELASGYWNSMALLGGKVPSRAVVDVTLGYKLDGITITGTVANVANNKTPDVLGAPTPGRFAWLQVAYDWDGLRY